MPDQPLISFVMITFNQKDFIREAVASAFSQTYSPLEIILSDDASADGTPDILQEMADAYHGPHTVRVNRTPKNLGLAGHINHIMELAKGELIVIAAGDDVSLPGRTDVIYKAWEKSGRKALSLSSHIVRMDQHGKNLGELRCKENIDNHDLVARSRNGCWKVMGCAHAWHRKVFDVFGPLQNYVTSEDRAIEYRAAALGEVVVIHDFLVKYRVHDASMSTISHSASREKKLALHMRMLRSRHDMFRQHLIDLERLECLGLCTPLESIQARAAIAWRMNAYYLEGQYMPASPLRRIGIALQAFRQISFKRGLKWLSTIFS